MKLNHYVYIFLGTELDPIKDRATIKTAHYTFSAIGVAFNDKEKVLALAQQAVKDGAQLIELCGGFGPIWVGKVSEAINNKVPVGTVVYGPEARKPILDLLS